VRAVPALLVGVLPHCRLKTLLMSRLLGWSVHPTATVAPCLFVRVRRVSLGAGARLLGLSAFYDVDDLVLGDDAVVGRWNWLSAARELRTAVLDARAGGRPATLRLGRGAAITSRHYIDCSGGVDIGAFSVLAGVRSTVLTHQVDLARSEQDVRPVRVGDYCLVGSNAKLVPGASIPDRCVIAMGSVVAGALPDAGHLYAGVPARAVKPVEDGLYFTRTDASAGIP
jgi:acetyltransferase-like isoleucine patch superfamily enzyme